jgi:ribosomal protein L37AE/L43A
MLVYLCPKCGSATKADQTKGYRICAARKCRHRFAAKGAKQTEVADESAPKYPCPKCGSESKVHTPGKRICSARKCRFVFAA